MKYTYLNVFYTVAKCQNISMAAKELGVTQPAVSRIITTIEKEYKTKLFHRSKTGVTLTGEGLNLFEMIENPFTELEKVDNSLKDITSLKQRVVHIGATTVALYCFLFSNLDRLKQKFPYVSFKVYTDSSDNLLKLVEKGKIDFAFVTTPSKAPEQIETINFYKLETCLVAPNKFKNELSGLVKVKQLEKYPFVLLNKEMQFREHINQYLAKNKTKINPVYEIDSSALLPPFVENALCLTFIPIAMAKKHIEEKRFFKVDLEEEPPHRYISFAIKKGFAHSSIIEEIKKEIVG